MMDEDDETSWSLNMNESISHNTEISSLLAISDQILVTHSQEDCILKIWEIGSEGADCLYQFKLVIPLISMLYDHSTKCLAVMDKQCRIAVFKRDFVTADEALSSQAIQAEVHAPDDEEIADAIDSDDFEMNDLENIDLDDENAVEAPKPANTVTVE